jgi:hypothetical protein
MSGVEMTLALRARRSYELGRLGWACRWALVTALLAMVTLVGGPPPAAPLACVALLAGALTTFLWSGKSWARGARGGLLAGLTPCLLPALVRAVHVSCAAICPSTNSVCIAAGVMAGIVLGVCAREAARDVRFALAAGVVATLFGAVGCLSAGLAGVAGMGIGMLAGAAVPVLISRPAA